MTKKHAASTLQEVLSYENPRLLNKFRTLFSVSAEEAQRIFIETKKWLWLCAKRKSDQMNGDIASKDPLVIHVGMVIIDECWHTFILHTQDYMDFCQKHFGFYVHHSPGNPDFVPLTEAQTRAQIAHIWDELGEDTVLRWYDEYAEKYSPAALRALLRTPEFGRPCEAL